MTFVTRGSLDLWYSYAVGPRVLGTLALVLAPAVIGAQAPPPSGRAASFDTGIEVIHLNVSVLDGQNRYVTQLAEGDFTVLEDGVRQELSLFTRETVPISLVLLLDCSASMVLKLPVAQAAGVRFIRTLRPGDTAQVAQFNERLSVLQDFTADHQLLEQAVRGVQVSTGATSLYTSLYVALKALAKEGQRGDLRRRAIVLLTDGEDTASLVTDEQILDLARHLEIAVYTVGLRQSVPIDRSAMAFARATHFLTALARDTGAQSHFPAALSELDVVYDRIAEELRTQYTLGYVSINKHRDGKWRRVAVRTPGHEDLQVRHNIGYYAPKGQSVRTSSHSLLDDPGSR